MKIQKTNIFDDFFFQKFQLQHFSFLYSQGFCAKIKKNKFNMGIFPKIKITSDLD